MEFNHSHNGIELTNDDFYILFGNSNLKVSTYKSEIQENQNTELSFHYVNQVHGDGVQILEESSQQPEEADAIFCKKKNHALLIKTADCIPVCIFNSHKKEIAMVHAGWRGVLNDICLKTIRQMDYEKASQLSIFLGPHIHGSSFQVKEDLIKLFRSKFPFIKSPTHYVKDLSLEGHFYLDISKILKDRLFHELKESINIQDSNINTFQHDSFHSYRRDKDQAGRNLNIAYLR